MDLEEQQPKARNLEDRSRGGCAWSGGGVCTVEDSVREAGEAGGGGEQRCSPFSASGLSGAAIKPTQTLCDTHKDRTTDGE